MKGDVEGKHTLWHVQKKPDERIEVPHTFGCLEVVEYDTILTNTKVGGAK